MTDLIEPNRQPNDGTAAAGSSIVVIGDALIDELRDESGAHEFVGGAALNVAVGLSVLAVDTTLVAMVRDDADGQRIGDFLRDHGVRLLSSPSPHGSARAISDRRDGEPRYVFNDAARRRWIDFDDDVRLALDAARHVVISNSTGIDGFYGASSMERLPTERALVQQVRRFAALTSD